VAKSTHAHVEGKSCAQCQTEKPLNHFPRVGVGYGKVCHPCLGEEVPGPGQKTCKGCKRAKSLEEFSSKGRGRGPMPKCKGCISGIRRVEYHEDPEKHRARRVEYYWNNREKSLAAVAKWRRENPPDPEVERAKRRAWYLANPGKAYEQASKWRLANPDRWREINRVGAARRRAADPGPVREVGRRAMSRRRARLRGLPCEPYTLAELLERDGTDCVLCGEPLDLTASYPDPNAPTVEHLVCLSWPDAATAGDVPSNCGVSHWGCNNSRRDKPHPAAARKRAELLAAEAATT
jgi:hypothetical protein